MGFYGPVPGVSQKYAIQIELECGKSAAFLEPDHALQSPSCLNRATSARGFLAFSHVCNTQQVPCRYLVGFPYKTSLFPFVPHGILTLLSPSGGGVGGLTLAFALSKSPNIRVDVYEAASKFTEIGAGISVWWRTRQVLKSLGLEEDVNRLLSFRPGQDRGEPSDT